MAWRLSAGDNGGGAGRDLVVGGPAEPRPPLRPPPQTQTGPAAASPLIVQINQVPDVIAEVDSGHYTPWIGLTAATNMDAEPAVGLGMCHPTPCPEPQPTGLGGLAACGSWFMGREPSSCS